MQYCIVQDFENSKTKVKQTVFFQFSHKNKKLHITKHSPSFSHNKSKEKIQRKPQNTQHLVLTQTNIPPHPPSNPATYLSPKALLFFPIVSSPALSHPNQFSQWSKLARWSPDYRINVHADRVSPPPRPESLINPPLTPNLMAVKKSN